MIDADKSIVTKRIGPLWQDSQYRDTKDPCPVFDGNQWHIFGSGGSVGGEIREEWGILHATASQVEGPWTEQATVQLKGLSGKHIAAPGVVYENGIFHMFVQTEYLHLGGTLEYLTSNDGNTFKLQNTAIESLPGTDEAALYDVHPAIIRGKKYLTYSGSNFIGDLVFEGAPEGWYPSVGMPDIYLAVSESNTWLGPWARVGKILDHEEVVHHNQKNHLSYEWGLEGPQLVELPNGIILLNAVCFLPHGEYGTRQRIFFAFASSVKGPYRSVGTILKPVAEEWDSGENGHATAFMSGLDLVLFYQGRPPQLQPWRYGIAVLSVKTLEQIGKATLQYHRALEKITKQKKKNQITGYTNKFAHNKAVISLADYVRELRVKVRAFQNRNDT